MNSVAVRFGNTVRDIARMAIIPDGITVGPRRNRCGTEGEGQRARN